MRWSALAWLVGLVGLGAAGAAQNPGSRAYAPPFEESDELAQIPGSLLLAAPGELSTAAKSAFVQLARGGAGRVVVLYESKKHAPRVNWLDDGSRSQRSFLVKRATDLDKPKVLTALLRADGIWIASLPQAVRRTPLVRDLLVSAMKRGAVVGASGEAAELLTGEPDVDAGRVGLVPRLRLVFGTQDPGKEDTHHRVARVEPGRVVAAIPDGAAIAVYGGRRVALLGQGKVGFAVYRGGEQLVSEQVLPCRNQRDVGDPFAYRLDLLSWIRRARAAEAPVYPPAKPGVPSVGTGSLMVQGGGGVTESSWRRFIELAGGNDARFVCIPSASDVHDDAPSSYSAQQLEELGCSNVRIVHVAQRVRANHDQGLIDAIDSSNAVWIDGGRTFRFMDRFGQTRAAEAIQRVLARGGVVGGSSAGCQVVGDFLVRGNPKSNSKLTDPGYLTGLQLIRGVVFDAHFRERNREAQFGALISKHPQLLGIGVDANTALLIQGSVGTVMGRNGVNVFDRREGRTAQEQGNKFESGARFDLVTGRALTK